MAQPDFYHLEIESDNVEFSCYLNGFPVYSSSDKNESSVSLPVHVYLIGSDNKLLIEAEAIDKSKEGKVNAHISEYQNGEVVVTNDLKSGGPELSIKTTDKEKRDLVFDNQRFDFSKTLMKGDILNSSEVQAYALKLWKYKEQGDAKGFVGEMRLKINDYAAAHEYSADQMREGLTAQFDQTFFKKKDAAIIIDQVGLESYNGGRVWEIKIEGHEFLNITEDDGSMFMSVYVASFDEELGIIR